MNGSSLTVVTNEMAETLTLRAEALDRFRRRYAHNPESQRGMLGCLQRLATVFSRGQYDETTFPWELLCDEDLTSTMWSTVAAWYSRKTAQKDASALRAILDCCRKVGLMTHEEYQLARSFDTKKGGQNRPQAGHYLSLNDLAQIADECEHGSGCDNTRIRDTALLHTLASTGARGDEVTGMQVENTHLPELRIWLTRTKSGSPRDAWLNPQAAEAVSSWLTVRGRQPGPLFLPLSRTGRPMLEHGELGTRQARKVIRNRAAAAGFRDIGMHDLRRFVITNMLDQGVDLARVAKVVGHTNPSTTAGYDRRPAQKMREAVATIQLPRLPQ